MHIILKIVCRLKKCHLEEQRRHDRVSENNISFIGMVDDHREMWICEAKVCYL